MIFRAFKNPLCLSSLFLSFSLLGSSLDQEQTLKEHFFSPEVTSLEVSDWYNPTVQDYRTIQKFLSTKIKRIVETPVSSRPFSSQFLNTEFYGWITYRMNRGDLVGADTTESPKLRVHYFNNKPSAKKKCVICYTSYPIAGSGDRDYKRGIAYIIESLRRHHFDGHFIYYIGGWPNVQKGRLKYVDVPYSFKPFLFEEVRDMGYENVLWIDAATIPVKNLDPIFDLIMKNGLCFVGDLSPIPWNEFNRSYKILIPSLQLNKTYKDLVSQVVGLNLKDPRGVKLLNAWIKAAEQKLPFLLSDQPPFVFLVNDMNLLSGKLPSSYCLETPSGCGNFAYWKHNKKTILYHQYDFLNTQFSIPEDFFDH